MTDDHDLRSQLERLASSVGDPPEHGLERVAARRHRRQRRRRGAVAAATVLAVLSAAAVIVERSDDSDTVTGLEQSGPAAAPPELPRTVQVLCTPEGIEVPVASVRPERDGLHIEVVNSLGEATTLQVVSPKWSSGVIDIPVGTSEVRQPVPPGELTISCSIDGRLDRRRVDLADVGGYYRNPELTCPPQEIVTLRDLPVEPDDGGSLISAARGTLEPRLTPSSDGLVIGAVQGYLSQRLADPTADPVVQASRDDDVIAFVHLRGAGGAAAPPWVVASEVDVCAGALEEPPGGAGTTETSDGAGDGGTQEP